MFLGYLEVNAIRNKSDLIFDVIYTKAKYELKHGVSVLE